MFPQDVYINKDGAEEFCSQISWKPQVRTYLYRELLRALRVLLCIMGLSMQHFPNSSDCEIPLLEINVPQHMFWEMFCRPKVWSKD